MCPFSPFSHGKNMFCVNNYTKEIYIQAIHVTLTTYVEENCLDNTIK